ncbi:MAG: endonuclease VIII [Firmicutes bacterium]|nr:endonuclease VIII [Bacillota bacterium]
MLELPEAYVISRQLTQALRGRTIQTVEANKSPHGFAWFFGDPALYPGLLTGRTFGDTLAVGGQVQSDLEGVRLLLGEGVNIRLYAPGAKLPPKHQLFLGLDDGSALVCGVQMYGGLWAFTDGANDNPYYKAALEKPSPFTGAFDEKYFEALYKGAKPTLSAKAFLATEQRIPGFGNGVLQDVLFLRGIHPARPLKTLTGDDMTQLFQTLKQTLADMADAGGRDTEKDLYGKEGGYRTLLSRKTWAYPCPKCGGRIERKAYLGGNVYFCPDCQPVR